jgi:amino acid permease
MPDVTQLLAQYGLTMTEIGAISALVVFTVALLKKHLSLKGNWLLVGALVATVVWTCMAYIPLPKPVAAGVFVFVVAVGGFQTAKDLLGKIGEDGPANKPLGAGDRRIDG